MSEDLFTYSRQRDNEIYELTRCNTNAEGKVIVPDGVTYIDHHAFHGCIYITEIVLPNSLCGIGDCAFEDCISLERINIPEKVTYLGWYLFEGCKNLKEIICHNSIEGIGAHAFQNCKSLVDFPFTDNITSIGYFAFSGCNSLRRIHISKKLEKISFDAFTNCSSIETLEIPSNIKSIGSSAFANCKNLRKVIIHSNEIRIAPSAFLGCSSITTVSLNSNPERIITYFPDCENLKSIYVLSGTNAPYKLDPNTIKSLHEENLRYMTLYYRLFGMNISQIKWDKDKDKFPNFKNPLDNDWKRFCKEKQSLDYILNWNWKDGAGLGIILGYNQYRALDIDIANTKLFEKIYPNRGINGLIDEMLDILHLPLDYPWVVRSGSGCGFHIIFKCEDSQATADIDTISYSPNDYYAELTEEKFIRVELRWNAHLVLPPSLHTGGYHYKFRNESLPISSPSHINLSSIEELVYKYCSEITYYPLSYNGIDFYLAENKKIESRYRYDGVKERNYNIDSELWLKQALHEEDSNTLAIKLLLGDEIECDIEAGIKTLENLNCQTAKYNLLNLHACGFIQLPQSEIKRLYEDLDKELFHGHLDFINEKITLASKNDKTFILFDTETIGLPKDYKAPASADDNYPRLVQLSWLVVDSELNIISENDYIIEPDGFTIPVSSSKIHGITTEIALEEGYPLVEVLQKFIIDFKKSSKSIGHNIDFDKKVVASELLRVGMDDVISGSPSECTMKSTVDFCKISGPYGYKYPKLNELYDLLFGSDFEDAHNSLADIRATLKCYKELKKRGIM